MGSIAWLEIWLAVRSWRNQSAITSLKQSASSSRRDFCSLVIYFLVLTFNSCNTRKLLRFRFLLANSLSPRKKVSRSRKIFVAVPSNRYSLLRGLRCHVHAEIISLTQLARFISASTFFTAAAVSYRHATNWVSIAFRAYEFFVWLQKN